MPPSRRVESSRAYVIITPRTYHIAPRARRLHAIDFAADDDSKDDDNEREDDDNPRAAVQPRTTGVLQAQPMVGHVKQ